MIGKVVGNYKIQAKLGEGGMGAVYQGVDTMLDREVAIKALRPELASQTAVVERFRSEAVTLAKLHHPNIATLYSLFRQGDELYMVLEFVRGETLDEILNRRGALPAEEVIPVFCQILDGINHAHEFGIIHRDIKPANMMLTEDGKLKVLDFGIARLLGTNRMTRAGNIIGTLEYMSPEQVKGQETDARSDIYALGMMLYEILTGRLPFETENEFELMKLQIESLPPIPRSINPSIPQVIEEAIMRSIQKNPENRFQTAGEFRETLLSAGFATQGSMRRSNTGGHQQQGLEKRNSVLQPISKPDLITEGHSEQVKSEIKETRLGGQPGSQPHEIKETRLGGNLKTPPSQPHEIKETRLGEGVTTSSGVPFNSSYIESPSSFFNNLTWIHYAGAGGVMVVCVFLFLVTIYAFSGGSELEKPVVETKPTPIPTVEVKPQKTPEESKTISTSTTTVSDPAISEQPTPISADVLDKQIKDITDKQKKDNDDADNSGSGGESSKKTGVAKTVKTPRPTPVKTPVRDRKPRGGTTIQDTRCALTGDC